jgi:hypothetical protein
MALIPLNVCSLILFHVTVPPLTQKYRFLITGFRDFEYLEIQQLRLTSVRYTVSKTDQSENIYRKHVTVPLRGRRW